MTKNFHEKEKRKGNEITSTKKSEMGKISSNVILQLISSSGIVISLK